MFPSAFMAGAWLLGSSLPQQELLAGAIGGTAAVLLVFLLRRAVLRRWLRRAEQHNRVELQRLTPVAEWTDAGGRSCRYTLHGLIADGTILCVVLAGGSLTGSVTKAREGLLLRLESPQENTYYIGARPARWTWDPLAPLWSTATVILPQGREGQRVVEALLRDPRIQDSRARSSA